MNFSMQLACTITHVHALRVFLDHIEASVCCFLHTEALLEAQNCC